MFDHHVRQLNGSIPSQRKQAINFIARSDDPRAKTVLEQHVERESDPELKLYAQKGLQYIKVNQGGQTGAIKAQSALPDINTAKKATGPQLKIGDGMAGYSNLAQPMQIGRSSDQAPVSSANQKKARNLLTNAITQQFSGQSKGALGDFKAALKLDPTLADDNSAQTLAVSLVGGGEPQVAIRRIIEGFKPSRGNNSGASGASSDGGFGNSLIEFLLVLVVVLMINLVGTVALFNKFKELSAILLDYINANVATQSQLTPAALSSLVVQPDTVLVAAITGGLQFLATSLITGTVLWFVGRMIGGEGGWIPFQTVNLFFSATINLIYSLAFFFTPTRVFKEFLDSPNESFGQSLAVVSFVGSVILLIAWTWMLARVHKFGVGKGCLMQVISIAVFIGFSCALGFLLQSAPGLVRP